MSVSGFDFQTSIFLLFDHYLCAWLYVGDRLMGEFLNVENPRSGSHTIQDLVELTNQQKARFRAHKPTEMRLNYQIAGFKAVQKILNCE